MTAKQEDQVAGSLSAKSPGQTELKSWTDTGWAWVVMIGAFLVNFSTIGFHSSLGVYLTVWMEDFETSAATAGLVLSVGAVMRGTLSTFSGALCTRFGSRFMTIVGGVLTVGGILMCAFAPSIEFLIISNGLVIALGTNLAFVSAFQALGMYFQRKFAIAAGLASAGVSVGQLALAPLYTFLIDKYGWRGSMFITAALSMHIVASGALMRPNDGKTQQANNRQGQLAVDTVVRSDAMITNQHRDDSDQDISKLNGKTSSTDNLIESGSQETETVLQGSVNKCDNDIGVPHHDSGVVFQTSSGGHLVESLKANDPPTESVAIAPSLIAFTVDESDRLSISKSVIKPVSAIEFVVFSLSRFKHYMLDTYGLRRLVHNSKYILMLFVAFSLGAGALCIAYIVPRATSIGLDAEAASLLLSMVGAGSILGRISNGWFIDKKYITAELLFASALLIYSVSVFLTPAFTTFPPMICLSGVFGVALGICSILFLVTVRSLVPPTDAIGAVGVQLFVWSLGNATGVFAAGAIYDATQTYDFAFFISGGSLLMASLLAFVLYFLQKRKRSHDLVTSKADTELLCESTANNQQHEVDSSSRQVVSELETSASSADIVQVRHACTSTEDD